MGDFFAALKGEPGYTYGDILPYRYRSAAPGEPRTPGTPIEFALPNAAREAIGTLADALSTPREALLGHLSEGELDRRGAMIGPELAMAGMGVPAPGGAMAMRVFGGPLAKTADKAALGEAFTLESRLKSAGYGKDAVRDAVHKATGWFRGADDKWRFEIPDSGAHLQTPSGTQGLQKELEFEGDSGIPVGTLGDYLHHPELYAAYPDMKNIMLKNLVGRDALGSYNHATQTIGVSARQNPESMLSTLIHEPQHAIQARENFAYGGSPTQFLRPDWHEDYEEGMKQYGDASLALRKKGIDPTLVNQGLLNSEGVNNPHVRAALQEAPSEFENWLNARNTLAPLHQEKEAAWNMYNGLAGEVEARLAQARQAEALNSGAWNPFVAETYYKTVPPWMTHGGDAWVPPEDQIIQFATEPGRAK